MTPLTSSLPLVGTAVSVRAARRIRYMLCVFPSTYRVSLLSAATIWCAFGLKITSSHTCFLLSVVFSFHFQSLPFHIFSLPSWLPSLPPPPCIYLRLTLLWRVHGVPVNKNTIWIFLRPAPEETYEDWYVLCLLLTVTFRARLLLLAAHKNSSWRGHVSNRRCTCEVTAHNLFQYRDTVTSFSSKGLT